ncbi:MAG TPA: hypothetical protein VEF55_01005 [Candidatus Binatia bacterium]|nr:hypothetical protein [Candidatus Binatia bacterium]
MAALSALTLAACNRTGPQADETQQIVENGCPAAASATWEGMQVEASANGGDCASAQATITIDNGGAVVWSENYPVRQVMVLAGPESVEDMQRRLNEWVNPPGAARDSTGDLPVWAAGAPHPMSGEFPFYTEEGVDRPRYETLRGADAPMFCYVQGMESEACLTLENGRVTKIGVQSFPG